MQEPDRDNNIKCQFMLPEELNWGRGERTLQQERVQLKKNIFQIICECKILFI